MASAAFIPEAYLSCNDFLGSQADKFRFRGIFAAFQLPSGSLSPCFFHGTLLSRAQCLMRPRKRVFLTSSPPLPGRRHVRARVGEGAGYATSHCWSQPVNPSSSALARTASASVVRPSDWRAKALPAQALAYCGLNSMALLNARNASS